MAPYELENLTLKQLRDTRNAMSQLDYLIGLSDLSTEKQKEAALLSIKYQYAYQTMVNKELGEIRDQLVANEKELIGLSEKLQLTLNNLKKIEQIVAAAGSFLAIVAKIIPIA